MERMQQIHESKLQTTKQNTCLQICNVKLNEPGTACYENCIQQFQKLFEMAKEIVEQR